MYTAINQGPITGAKNKRIVTQNTCMLCDFYVLVQNSSASLRWSVTRQVHVTDGYYVVSHQSRLLEPCNPIEFLP